LRPPLENRAMDCAESTEHIGVLYAMEKGSRRAAEERREPGPWCPVCLDGKAPVTSIFYRANPKQRRDPVCGDLLCQMLARTAEWGRKRAQNLQMRPKPPRKGECNPPCGLKSVGRRRNHFMGKYSCVGGLCSSIRFMNVRTNSLTSLDSLFAKLTRRVSRRICSSRTSPAGGWDA
jgi:hypothetical protein